MRGLCAGNRRVLGFIHHCPRAGAAQPEQLSRRISHINLRNLGESFRGEKVESHQKSCRESYRLCASSRKCSGTQKLTYLIYERLAKYLLFARKNFPDTTQKQRALSWGRESLCILTNSKTPWSSNFAQQNSLYSHVATLFQSCRFKARYKSWHTVYGCLLHQHDTGIDQIFLMGSVLISLY